jgi:hypothetical protein
VAPPSFLYRTGLISPVLPRPVLAHARMLKRDTRGSLASATGLCSHKPRVCSHKVVQKVRESGRSGARSSRFFPNRCARYLAFSIQIACGWIWHMASCTKRGSTHQNQSTCASLPAVTMSSRSKRLRYFDIVPTLCEYTGWERPHA